MVHLLSLFKRICDGIVVRRSSNASTFHWFDNASYFPVCHYVYLPQMSKLPTVSVISIGKRHKPKFHHNFDFPFSLMIWLPSSPLFPSQSLRRTQWILRKDIVHWRRERLSLGNQLLRFQLWKAALLCSPWAYNGWISQRILKLALKCIVFNSNNKSIILLPVWASRFPVGSSASNNGGVVANARAMATRCCSPPDKVVG